MRNKLDADTTRIVTAQLRDLITTLHHRRDAQNITRTSLARALNLTIMAVTFWETEYQTPTTANFILWAEALDCRLALTDHHGDTRPPARPVPRSGGEEPCSYRLRCLTLALRDIRLDADLTQDAISNTLNVSTWTIQQWENSGRIPSLPNLLAWSHALRCRITLRTRHAASTHHTTAAPPTPSDPDEGDR